MEYPGGLPVKARICAACMHQGARKEARPRCHPHGYDLWNTLEALAGEGAYLRRVYALDGYG